MARTLAVTWGDPHSAFTYSGVPWHLFGELDRRGELVGRADADQRRRSDLLRGTVDVRRSLADRRPRANALWRYLPANIELLSRRFAAVQRTLPDHDAVLQFGVAGIPGTAALVAHIEIPVELAVSNPAYARSYGFDRVSPRVLDEVLAGQRAFLDACSLVWTNSQWTADAIVAAGCPVDKVRWCPPGCGAADPGPIERDWSRCHIVFVGKEWEHKGGPALLDAFRAVRARRPDARLTVIGCRPDVHEAGVSVLGYLRKDVPAEAEAIDAALRDATIFCMPSLWESTGVVYMEAALYGLPVVMVTGQGRQAIFEAGALILDDADPERLAVALRGLADDPDRMREMGSAGRSLVLDRYMWSRVAETVSGYLAEAAGERPGADRAAGDVTC